MLEYWAVAPIAYSAVVTVVTLSCVLCSIDLSMTPPDLPPPIAWFVCDDISATLKASV